MPSAFHLISLPMTREEDTLEAALAALADVEPGEAVFFSEALAWTAEGSGVAFARLVRAARERDVNLVATLNLGGELLEDLPGRAPDARHHALVVFTRHGDVHAPQAKALPDAIERREDGDAAPVEPYPRANLIRIDMAEQLIEVRFLLGADLALLGDHAPAAWACDVLVSLARFPLGAEEQARRALADARQAGLCSTTIQINGHHAGADGATAAVKIEEAGDHGRVIAAKARWPQPRTLARRLYRYTARQVSRDREPAPAVERMAARAERSGRIPVLRPLKAPKITLGVYPITIVM